MFSPELSKKIVATWYFLTGTPENTPLQSRIYHSICLISVLATLYNIPFNLAFDMSPSAWAAVFLAPVQLFLYYLSRFKHRTHLSFVIYAILINIFFSLIYKINAGLQGPTLLLFSIAYLPIIAIAPAKQYWYWTLGHLVLVIGLIWWDYHHPEFAPYSYKHAAEHYIDMTSTYIINVIVILTILSFVINNYKKEKRVVEEKNKVLEQLNEQKNKLISVISHDFNTPLINIKKYLYILNKTDLEEKERKHLEEELRNLTYNTQNLLLNLLNWAKNNMQNMQFDPEEVNINKATEETVKIYRSIAQEKNIHFRYNISPEATAWGNREMIDIILRNLISNAVKFTAAGGSIQIESYRKNGHHTIIVKDSGTGIEDEIQGRLFDPGTLSTPGTQREEGMGIGLSLCKEFVEALKGTLWFESTAQEGTTFYLEIPAA